MFDKTFQELISELVQILKQTVDTEVDNAVKRAFAFIPYYYSWIPWFTVHPDKTVVDYIGFL